MNGDKDDAGRSTHDVQRTQTNGGRDRGKPAPKGDQPGAAPNRRLAVVDFLNGWEAWLQKEDEFAEQGERACILFADLVGSTEFKRYHHPIKGLAKSDQHNSIAHAQIVKHHGEVVKYLGDGVLALFRGPDCERCALFAGLGIITEVGLTNERLKWRFPMAMSTKVGVHAGDVWMFQFEGSDRDDPQGTTVDIAARLCAMAGPQQLICTDATYEQAGGVSTFPNATTPTPRFVRGVKEPLLLRAVAPADAPKCDRIPLGGGRHAAPDTIKQKLESARQRLAQGELDAASTAFEQIIIDDPGNFEANFRLADLLIQRVNGKSEKERLEEAVERLCWAKQMRPEASRVWLLLSWAKFKLAEMATDETLLREAIDYATRAEEWAIEYMDLDAMVQAKTHLAHCLFQLSKHVHDSEAAQALVRADELCEEVRITFGSVLEKHRSDYLATHAFVRLAKGDTEYEEIQAMIDAGKSADSTNPRVYQAEAELVRKKAGGSPRFVPGLGYTPDAQDVPGAGSP